MLEYDLLYGSETRPILSVGFFFFIKHGTVLGTRLSHTRLVPLRSSILFLFLSIPVTPSPPPPPQLPSTTTTTTTTLTRGFMFKGLLSTVRYTSSVSEHLYRSHPPPPRMLKGLLTTMRYTSTISSFNMGCLFIIRWKKVLSQSHTRSTDDLLLPVRDAQWSFFIFDSSPSLGPRVKSK